MRSNHCSHKLSTVYFFILLRYFCFNLAFCINLNPARIESLQIRSYLRTAYNLNSITRALEFECPVNDIHCHNSRLLHFLQKTTNFTLKTEFCVHFSAQLPLCSKCPPKPLRGACYDARHKGGYAARTLTVV